MATKNIKINSLHFNFILDKIKMLNKKFLQSGITPIYLKGFAINIEKLIPDRHISDVDIIINLEDYEIAKSVLESNDYICYRPLHKSEKEANFINNKFFCPIIIDLHIALSNNDVISKKLRFDEIKEDSRKVYDFLIPSHIHQFVHSIIHLYEHIAYNDDIEDKWIGDLLYFLQSKKFNRSTIARYLIARDLIYETFIVLNFSLEKCYSPILVSFKNYLQEESDFSSPNINYSGRTRYDNYIENLKSKKLKDKLMYIKYLCKYPDSRVSKDDSFVKILILNVVRISKGVFKYCKSCFK